MASLLNRINPTSVYTVAEHTECCPGKERVRRDRILELQSDRRKPQGVFSISDALLPTLFYLNHTGIFQGCDIEKAMIDAINNHRPRKGCTSGNYPCVPIMEPMHMDVRLAIRILCERGEINRFGLIDLDLTATIKSLFNEIMPIILNDLSEYKYRGRIVVTAACRNDGFISHRMREGHIRFALPEGIEYVKSDSYSSNYYDRHRVFHRRTPMCQFILQGKPR